MGVSGAAAGVANVAADAADRGSADDGGAGVVVVVGGGGGGGVADAAVVVGQCPLYISDCTAGWRRRPRTPPKRTRWPQLPLLLL